MSGIEREPGPLDDRRVRRTRAVLLSAFREIVTEQGYGAANPGRVAELADVGRSTLYEHFRGKEDLLRKSLIPLLTQLARSSSAAEPENLTGALAHFWTNRRLAKALLVGRARVVIFRQLTELIELELATGGPRPPELGIVATQLAGGQLAALDEWLSGRHGCSAETMATLLQRTSAAIAGVARNRL